MSHNPIPPSNFLAPLLITNIPHPCTRDSAGVTTGPVTVPFVLAIGVGFSQAVDATEGFGILTSSSVAPIISVLLINLIKKPAKKVCRAEAHTLSCSGVLFCHVICCISTASSVTTLVAR